MPEKPSPWKRPKNNSWIKIGKRVAHNRGKHPRESPVFIITKIETTGNGARMVHLALEEDTTVVTAKWASDLLGGGGLGFGEPQWMPVPPPPRAPRLKKERKTRFEREDPV